MKNSVSEQDFYIASEGEDEENRRGEDANGYESDGDHSYYSLGHRRDSKVGSYNTTWPQSYRQSIDLLSSVSSPSISSMWGSPLSRFGSSFLSSSSLSSRHSDAISAATKPLIPAKEEEHHKEQRRSSLTLLPTVPSWRSSFRKDGRPSKSAHEAPVARHSSLGQAVLNGMNVLCGVGILSMPYALKEGGWASISVLLLYAVISFYTGILLRRCLDSEPGLETYPDIGQAAFGRWGRVMISIILHAELYASCVEYLILEGDNLSSLFPHAHLSLGGYDLNAKVLFAILTAIVVLPTVWLKDLSVLSYISAGGVIASLLVVFCLFWVGLVDHVGFESKGTILNLSTFPVVIGLYGFCYSGHAVLPNIYGSMARPSQYTAFLLLTIGICTVLYIGTAVLGYSMFAQSAKSQFTLNLPKDLVASKVAVWATVVNPFTKYALVMSPVAMSLEELIPSQHVNSHIYSILIRTALVISTLIVALLVPFFGLVLSLIGSLLTMLVNLIFPCACFLSILKGKVTIPQGALCFVIIVVGIISSAIGAFSSLAQIVKNLSG